MQKILYILADMEDFWAYRLPLAQAAQAQGREVHIAAPGAADDARLRAQGFGGFNLPATDRNFSAVALARHVAAIDKALRDIQPRIVHAITLKYAFMTGLAARRYKNIKPVYTIAGLGYFFTGQGVRPAMLRLGVTPLIKYALANAAIIVQNPDDRETLIRRKFIRPEQCRLIRGSGVDLLRFSPRAEAQQSDPPLVVMPTRLIRDKGIEIFIEAAKILKARGVHARFQIAGGPAPHNPLAISAAEMERMIKGTGVEWLGKVTDMPALYASAALIVYPSYYGEGIPRVLLEAAAMGKAIVTTDHPGCCEAVRHGENGLLVPVKDPAATAAAIEQSLRDDALRARMGAAGRARAESEFDANLIVAQTLVVYGSL